MKDIVKLIPNYVYDVAIALEMAGFEAYLVGGSLRNILSGFAPKDYDLTTNASPEEIISVFPKAVSTNAKFGTITVLTTNDSGEFDNVEVTTYRLEKEYASGRWPSQVEFTKNLEEDLKRRDFTVNALALRIAPEGIKVEFDSPEIISNSPQLVDLFNGKLDLESKILRAVGDAEERFQEDGLRAMRACRLASVYGFKIEQNTFDAIKNSLEIAAMISKERIRDELIKIVEKSPVPSIGIELMRTTGLLELYIPELLEGYKLEQNKYHVHDVYEHSLRTMNIAPEEIRFAALFHDIAKPRCKDGEHFYGHDIEGAKMTEEILTRLKFPTEFIKKTVLLIRWHMFYLPHSHEIDSTDSETKSERDIAFKTGWSDSAIRRMIVRVGGYDNIEDLLKLRIADATANPKSSFNPEDVRYLSQRVAELKEKESIISVKDLKISGKDLMEIGIPQGPEIRKVLEHLLALVIEDISYNDRDKLLTEAKAFAQ